MALHQRITHPTYVDGCFSCKITSVQTGNVFMPQAGVAEGQWEKDLPAYKRLRDQGYQPKTTSGSAHLEAHATTEYEIVTGRVQKDAPKLQEALRIFEDTHGHSALTPQTTPKPIPTTQD